MSGTPRLSCAIICTYTGPNRPTPEVMQALVQYTMKVSPEGAVKVVTQCARDGEDFWRAFFDSGFANTIATDPALHRAFFRRLIGDDPGPYAADVLGGYLDGLTPNNLDRFFGAEALDDKNHPAATIHHRASFKTEVGESFVDLLEVLIKAGLRGRLLRSFVFEKHNRRSDVERACLTRHVAYLKQVMPNIGRLPDVIVERLLGHAELGPAAIEYLVLQCKLDLSVFTNDNVRWSMCPEVQQRLIAIRWGITHVQRRSRQFPS